MRITISIEEEKTESRESRIFWQGKARDYYDEYGYLLSEAEQYELEKEVNKQWLFDVKQPLEDDYTEESDPW